MKRRIAPTMTPLFVLLTVLTGTAYAQRSPSDEVRESNDPDRAAEVERKAEAISGRSLEGSGESGEDANETLTKPIEPRTPEEERSEGESGGTQESSELPDQVQPLPESSGESGSKAPNGGRGNEGKTKQSSPADTGDTYH